MLPRPLITGLLALAVLLAGLAGCGPEPRPPEEGPALERVDPADWPVLYDDLDAASLHQACRQSIGYLRRVPADRRFAFADYSVTAREMIAGLQRLRDVLVRLPDPLERTEALKQHFILFRSRGRDGRGEVLMTGYYEPVLEARRRRQPPFVHPLYAVPEDLVWIDLEDFGGGLPDKRLVGQVRGRRVRPYPDREAIDFDNAIGDRAEVLAWVDDAVEAFFLHIQGSGQVRFADGRRLRLGYAATNGRPYRSIGRLLIDEGLMDAEGMSMQAIQRFLADNPRQLRRVLAHNPSYVFFRPLEAVGGPLGCYETPLTAGRSIATDRRIFPGLAACYIQGEAPAPDGGVAPLMRLVLNQDTGGAIRGPGRLDLFFGSGAAAGELAGRMKHPGRLYFLAPRR